MAYRRIRRCPKCAVERPAGEFDPLGAPGKPWGRTGLQRRRCPACGYADRTVRFTVVAADPAGTGARSAAEPAASDELMPVRAGMIAPHEADMAAKDGEHRASPRRRRRYGPPTDPETQAVVRWLDARLDFPVPPDSGDPDSLLGQIRQLRVDTNELMRSMLLTDLNRALVREGYAPLAALSDLYRDDTTTADADPMDDHPAGRGGGVRPRRGGRHERRPSTPRTGRLSGTSL